MIPDAFALSQMYMDVAFRRTADYFLLSAQWGNSFCSANEGCVYQPKGANAGPLERGACLVLGWLRLKRRSTFPEVGSVYSS